MTTELSTGVFDRQSGEDTMSARLFFLVLGGVLLYGKTGAWFLATKTNLALNWLSALCLGVIIPICGVFVALKAKNFIISFLGYNFMVAPLGIVLGSSFGIYLNVFQNCFALVFVSSGVMAMLAVIHPPLFSELNKSLFISVVGVVAISITQFFRPFLTGLTIFDWLGALACSLCIGYDWHRAMSVSKTLHNAMDVAIDLFLDFINLFFRLVKLIFDMINYSVKKISDKIKSS